jgi:hypothetical protein
MLQTAISCLGICLFAVWVVTAISAIGAWRHRARNVSMRDKLFRPLRAFTAEARPHIRRWSISAALFVSIGALMAILAAIDHG